MTEAEPSDELFILLVDDDHEDIYSIRRAFSGCDYKLRFESCSSGEALFERLDRKDDKSAREHALPDVLLLDLNLPKISGFEILKRLRSEPDPILIPIIVLSTSASDADVSRCYRSGANVFFTKPATFSETKSIANSIVEFWTTSGLKRASV